MDDAREVLRLSEYERQSADGPSDVNHLAADAGAPTWSSAQPDPSRLAEILDLVDQAVLICDGSAKLQWCNAAAKAAVPGIQHGEILAGPLFQAMTRGVEHFAAEIGGRFLTGRRVAYISAAGTAQFAWFLRDERPVQTSTPDSGARLVSSVFLAEASRRLRVSLHPGRTARATVETAAPALADTAVVLLPLRGEWGIWHRAGLEPASGRFSKTAIDSSPLLAKALGGQLTSPVQCGRSELTGVADALMPWWNDAGPALVVGLPGAGSPSGVLVLARGPHRQSFDAADTGLALEFAAQAGMALAAAASYAEHADVATALRGQLVPNALPDLPDVRLAAAHRPAQQGLQLGGDFYYVRPAAHGPGIDSPSATCAAMARKPR